MAEETILARIRPRGGTAIIWASINPTLKEREIGIETDTGKFKTGDGVTAWNDLPYTVGATGATGPQGIQGIQGEPGITIPDPSGLTTETDILDADKFLFSQGSSLLNVLWSTVKSKLVAYFNTLYGALVNTPTADQKAAITQKANGEKLASWIIRTLLK